MDDYRNTIGDGSLPLGALSPGGSKTGLIDVDGDVDVFSITLVAGTTYTFDMIGQAGGTLEDLQLGLQNNTGGYIYSSSGFSSKSAHILYTATVSGTFYLQASGIFGETGGYTLSASAGIVDDYRDSYDATLEASGAIAPGGSKAGLIETPGDVDVFQITLTAGTTYSFDMAGKAGGALTDTSLTLQNSTGGYVSSTSGFSNNPAHILYTATVSGTFYLAAAEIFDETGSYTITASPGFVDDYRDTYDNTLEAPGTIAPGGSKAGLIETPGDVDVFAVSLVAGTTYSIDMTGRAGGGLADTGLTVQGAAGQYLASDSGFSADPAHLLYTPDATGTYYLSVQGLFDETGGYTLSVGGSFVDDYRDTYGDTTEALGAVSPGGNAAGTIETGADTDIFAVSLTAGRTYTFDMLGQAGGALSDVSLSLLNDKGGSVGSASGFDGKAASFMYTASATGTFYLAADSAFDETGAYKVSVSGGYVDDYRDTYNDPSETLGALAFGGSKTGAIEIGGDSDVFAITLTAGQTYNFDLRGQPGGGGTLADAYLTLQNATGGMLGSGVSLGGTADERITYTATAGGTYYLTATSGTLAGTGTYTLSAAAGTAADDYRDSTGDTTAPLGSLSTNGSLAGSIETAGDKDIFAITLTAGQSYTFDLSKSASGGLADSELQLYKGSTLLAANNDFNGANSRIVYTAATTGTYYLDAHSATAGGTGSYVIRSTANADDFRDSIADTTAPFGNLSVNTSLLGSIEKAGDTDFFAVSLVAGQSYTFDLASSSVGGISLANTDLRLFNGTGAKLAINNDFNGTNSRIVYTAATTGTYYLDAHSIATTGTGNYQISAKLNFDDARDTVTDTTAPVGTLAINGSKLGSVETAGDKDIFAISLTAGQSYTFDLVGISSGGAALANTDLRLLNASGTVLFSNNDFNGTNSRIVYTAASTGTYYLDAHGITTTGTGNYQLSAKLNFDDARDTVTDTTASLTTLVAGVGRTGSIETKGDHDVFAVSLTTGQSYTFDLVGIKSGGVALVNAELTLLTGGGTVLFTSDDFNALNSRIVYTATSTGTFYLDAHSHTTTGTGAFVLTSTPGFDDFRDTITDKSAASGTLAVGATLKGTIETAGDSDVFAVSLQAGHHYQIDLDGGTAAGQLKDGDLELLNSGGAQLAYNDDINTDMDARIVFDAAYTGVHYINASGVSMNQGFYALSLHEIV